MEKLVNILESPFTSIRIFGIYKLYQLVKKDGLKVILEGDGGEGAAIGGCRVVGEVGAAGTETHGGGRGRDAAAAAAAADGGVGADPHAARGGEGA